MTWLNLQLAAVVATAAAIAGLFVALVADAHPITITALLAAPFALPAAIFLALAGVPNVLRASRYAAIACLAFFLPISTFPVFDAEPPEVDRPRSPCAQEAPPDRQLKVATWNAHGKRSGEHARVLADAIDADILLLQEVGSRDFVEEIARRWNGEGTFSPTLWGFGLGVVVRNGSFGECFADGQVLVKSLPAHGNRRAAALLVYARMKEGGSVPVIVFHNDRPATLEQVQGWPDILRGAGAVIARLAAHANPRAVIVGGDSNTHHNFRRFGGLVQSPGLRRASPRRTWPLHLDGVSSVPIYSLDAIWYGPHWNATDAPRTVAVPLESDHEFYEVSLEPLASASPG